MNTPYYNQSARAIHHTRMHTQTHLYPDPVVVRLTTYTNLLILQLCISSGVSQGPQKNFIIFTESDAAPHSLLPIPLH